MKFVRNRADQPLENVFEGDEPGRAAVLVEHDGQVALLAAQFVEQFSAPGEVAAPEAEATLKVEYLDAASEQHTVYVNGTLVQ